MPGKSGGAAQVLSLPKGGGALQGLGEKFQPDLYTGTGNFSIPIAIPPGRNGLQPQLALTYSTGQGNGPFGLGWNLSVPRVTLKTSQGIPRYQGEDVYVLSGAEDLVLVKKDSASSQCRPRTEGLFARIVHHQETNNDYWEVRSKDGLVSLYGMPGTAGHDPAVVANPDPTKRTKVFAWKLTQTADPFGNRIVYEYERDLGEDGLHHWDQLYLKCIRYVDYTDQSETKYLVSVTFVYADRPDPFSDYHAGFEIRTTKRCTHIEIRTHAEGDHLVRTYHLKYLDQQPLASEELPLNNVSLLHQICVEGRIDSTEEASAARNLLINPDFTTAYRDGSPIQVTGAGRGGPSAAAQWSVWNNYDGTTATALVASDFPGGTAKMIRVVTSGEPGGLVQTFLPNNAGPPETIAGAWVRVRRGRVGIRTGNGGSTGVDTVSTKINAWEHLEASNGTAPANEFIIYAVSPDGADFDVAVASVVHRSEWLPPLEFHYTQFAPTTRRFLPLQGRDLPARSLANPDLELVPLFGNGLPDILEMNGTVRYWRNLGDGRFDLPREMRTAPAGIGLADKGVQLLDANGDGRMDLLVTTESLAGYFPLQFGGLWGRSFQSYRLAPSFDLKDPEVRMVDLDGDGVTDAIRSGSRLECFFNDPKDGWNGTRWVERRALEEFPNVNFSDPHVKWADMTADGLQDIVLVHDGNVAYWPNLGYGNWGKRIHMRNSPRFPYGYDPKRILVGDVDGDGLADIVYVDNTKVTLWINQSGNGWSDPIVIKGTPPVSDMDAVRLADVLGTGVSGVLWSADASGLSRQHMFFLDFTGGTKPYLLHEMDNHLGAVTRVAYAPSTRFYLEDQKRPETRWITPLPFPVQVVARVEAIDALSGGKLTTEYRYHHGYWDGAEREFRGFGRVEHLDTESFDTYNQPGLHGASTPFNRVLDVTRFSPPTLTKTWFHQGPVGEEFGDWTEMDYSREFWSGDPPALKHVETVNDFLKNLQNRRVKRDALRTLRGSILRTELYALDGSARESRPYTVTEHAYGLREEMSPGPLSVDGEAQYHIFFPHMLAQRTTQWERGNDPMTQCTFTDDYDLYGQPRSQISIAVPRGRDFRVAAPPGQPYLATQVVTRYAQRNDAQHYLVDRVARTTTSEIINDGSPALFNLRDAVIAGLASRRIIGQTLHFYDGPAFQGLPFGQLGDYGTLVRTENLVLTEDILHEAYGDEFALLRWPIYSQDWESGIGGWFSKDGPTDAITLVADPTAPSPPLVQQISRQDTGGHYFSPLIPLQPGHTYCLAGWIRWVGGGWPFIGVDRYDSNGTLFGEAWLIGQQGYATGLGDTVTPMRADTTEWCWYGKTFTLDAKTAAVRIKTELWSGAAKPGNNLANIDNLAIYEGSWPPADYPQEFLDRLPPLAGYTYHSGDADAVFTTGYFATTERRRYDFQDDPSGKGRGLWKVVRDPLGRDTCIIYDAYALLPTKVTDPAKLTTSARYNYRVLQPQEVTAPNGNRTAYTFTPLGLLESTAVMGKVGEQVGDTLAMPGVRIEYDFLAFTDRAQPISVRTIKRVHHVNDTDVLQPQRDDTLESHEYSDGFGRLLQTRTQAEDVIFDNVGLSAGQSLPVGDAVGQQRVANEPPRVVVSGWQVYDNKGRVVEKYEPFFASDWEYAPPLDDQYGQKVTMYYDALGRVIRTVNPDGSEQRVVHGVPTALTNPDQFTPTPWEAYTYDANDNAGRTHPTASTRYQQHWNTPASALVDALGRTIATVERNGPNPATDWYTTHSTYDIRGNLLTVTDALGQVAFRHVYDLANRPLRIESLDAGTRRSVLDAASNVIEGRDSKGALVLHAYDVLHRPIRLWAQDGADQKLTLRELLVYGDSLDPAQAGATNLLGKLHTYYDEAGRLTITVYDFKGNVLEKARQVIRDDQILSVFAPAAKNNWVVQAFRVDWQPPAGMTLEDLAHDLLEPMAQETSLTYDALNRVKTMRYPVGVDGVRKALYPMYNRAGALESVKSDDTTYVERIAYNAKGQRTLIAYGNGVMTRHAYDQNFRLARLRTERYGTPAGTSLTYHPTTPNHPLQDFAYEYDLAGNILTLHDRTPASGLPAQPNQLDRAFTYDPLYRLLAATGRECDVPPPPPPWNDKPRCTDLTKVRGYTEQYQYDPVGNVQQLLHATTEGSFTRTFSLAAPSNRLATLTIGVTTYAYIYDANGNLTQETTSRHFEWDHSDRMRVYRTQIDGVEPSVHAHYLYDAGGQRVKKLVRKQGGQYEVTVYVDGIFEVQRTVQGGTTSKNNTLHVMDNQQRITLVRIGPAFPDDKTPAIKYQLGDHLGSNNVVMDDTGAWIDREEYTPYGETSFGSFARKRYRFTGKERDEESSLYYHGARYYAPWLARWVSCDPAGMVDGANLYRYVRNNPLRFTDLSGFETTEELSCHAWSAAPASEEKRSNFSLGANERYRDAIELGAKRTGTNPAASAAIINAEAAPIGGDQSKLGKLTDEEFYKQHPELNGRALKKEEKNLIAEWSHLNKKLKATWDPESLNSETGAAGLTQFLASTWKTEAQRKGSFLNEYVKKNKVVAEEKLLSLRYDPTLSIVAAAEYDATSLDRLALKKDASQKRYLIPGNLTEDQKARYLYLVHHEGKTGAEQVLNRTLSNDRAENLLKANVPDEETRDKLIKQYGSKSKAYTGWLWNYIDTHIVPSRFRQ